MALTGPDFRAGLRQPLYRPFNPVGLGQAIAIFVVLLIVNQLVLQVIFSVGIVGLTAGLADLLNSGLANTRTEFLRATLLSVLPAGLLTAWLAWIMARRRGIDAREVLALRFPVLGAAGWVAVIGGFVLSLYVFFALISWLFGIDVTSSGLVEQAVMRLSGDPLYLLVVGGLVIGAPLAEEVTFRGQIFSALSQTRIGVLGAAILTSAVWSGVHFTQPIHIIGLLFFMGLALSWLLVRFGSLWVTIACHAVWNALSVVVLYFMSLQ